MIRVTKSLFYKKVVAALKANGNDTPALRKQLREALLQNLSHEPNEVRIKTELALFEGYTETRLLGRKLVARTPADILIDQVYVWRETPQGHDFWETIHNATI